MLVDLGRNDLGRVATAGSVRGSDSASSRCSFLRRSTIERNASTAGLGSPALARKPWSCSKVRTDSVEGTIGTSIRSAALNTLSDTSEIDGAQSRIARS